MGLVTLGVDIGQRVDPTAIAVAEQDRRPRPDNPRVLEEHYIIRRMERLPLDTPYPKVAERLGVVLRGVLAQSGVMPTLYADATGVGQPVVDVLRANLGHQRIVAVYFTHGDRRTVEWGPHGKEVKLGKAWLVSRLQALLQTGRLHLPDTEEARALAEELRVYEIRVDQNANDKYGAFKVGTHDDLVTALGLAVQEFVIPPPPPMAVARRPMNERFGFPPELRTKGGFR